MSGTAAVVGRDGRLVAAGRLASVGLGLAVVVVAVARWVWDQGPVQVFVHRWPGTTEAGAQPGTPLWVCALHALNLFFLVLVVRSGLAVRTTRRPCGHWSPRSRRRGARQAAPISVEQWFHVAVDLVWMACGVLYVVLMAVSGRWTRLVPTSWDVLPGAASMALQYLSLHWPAQDTWVGYNALQQLSYAFVVLVLAPSAAITGLRQSFLWPSGGRLGRCMPLGASRAVHHVVMIAFVVFALVHVAMVLSTGAVTNLAHMFAARDDGSWLGVVGLVVVLAVVAGGWFAVRPVVMRSLAGLAGKVTR